MAKLPINPFLLLISRRTARVPVRKVAVAAGKEAALPSGDNVGTAVAATAVEKKKKKGKFWMRDPETGNWVPESEVGNGEIDVVDQRENLLPKKNML